jgi:hypothetical protein
MIKAAKYGPTAEQADDHWYKFDYDDETNTGATISTDNGVTEITLHLCDAKRGDSDLTENGVIKDPGAPVRAGLLARYPFDGNALDASGNGHHGVPSPHASLTTGLAGTPNAAYDIDGVMHPTDGRGISLRGFNLNGLDAFSISAWFNAHSIPREAALMTAIADVEAQFLLGPRSTHGNRMYFAVNTTGDGRNPRGYILSDDPITLGAWHHVAVTYDGRHVRMYIDGRLQESVLSKAGAVDRQPGIIIGAEGRNRGWPDSPDGYTQFDGSIDEVVFLDRAMRASEVEAYYHAYRTDPDGEGAGDNPKNDEDGDGVADVSDNCPAVANPSQSDADGDGAGDGCDASYGMCESGAARIAPISL